MWRELLEKKIDPFIPKLVKVLVKEVKCIDSRLKLGGQKINCSIGKCVFEKVCILIIKLKLFMKYLKIEIKIL